MILRVIVGFHHTTHYHTHNLTENQPACMLLDKQFVGKSNCDGQYDDYYPACDLITEHRTARHILKVNNRQFHIGQITYYHHNGRQQ